MELRNLQYFIFVYEELNFSKAAQKCFVSQPSISSAVMQLEKELGRQLFIRHAKGVSPTKAGEEFYPAALKIMNQIQAMQAMFASASPQMELRLALMPYLSGQLVGLIVKELIGSMPELNLSVVGWNDEADARIISQSMVLQNEVFHKLWRDKYVLVIPKEHTLARKERIALKDLNGISFVSRTFCDARDTWELRPAQTRGQSGLQGHRGHRGVCPGPGGGRAGGLPGAQPFRQTKAGPDQAAH